jgi:branched-chain amino acid transport system ATP-binding protein
MSLKVKDLVVNYGGAQALKGVFLTVTDGTIVSLIGANGAGKTTILRTLSRLVRATAGEIWFEEMNIVGATPKAVVKLGIIHVLEGRMLFPAMTIFENLMMGAYLRKDKSEIKRDLDEVFDCFPRLRERRSQLAGRLSGGEQQMLAVGRGMMAKPRLFLMDEPSLGLAPLIVDQIAQIITFINKKGVSILLVEQNARLALDLAHRAYVLENGKIALEGEAKQLKENEQVRKAYFGV